MPDPILSDDAGARALRVEFTCSPGGTPVLGARFPVPWADVFPPGGRCCLLA
jgi:hypothetical protein